MREIAETIPVLAVTTRAAKALLAEEEQESPWGLITAEEVIMDQAKDSLCQDIKKELDEHPGQDNEWNRQAFFYVDTNGFLC